MRARLALLAAPAVLGAVAILALARLDAGLDGRPAQGIAALGAVYGCSVAGLLLLVRGLPGPRVVWGAALGPVPVVLLLPTLRLVVGFEGVADARVLWIAGTALLGAGLGGVLPGPARGPRAATSRGPERPPRA